MSVLMSALALTFPNSQNTFQDLLTGKFTPMHFLQFILNYGYSHICRETYETKVEKTCLKLEKKKVLYSKYNKREEYKKFNHMLILYVQFHFTGN